MKLQIRTHSKSPKSRTKQNVEKAIQTENFPKLMKDTNL